MKAEIEVRVPNIGDFDNVDVIDVLVNPGDVVAIEDPLITLESDKAIMDIPAPQAGTIAEISVAVGDQVSEGALILKLTTPATGVAAAAAPTAAARTEAEPIAAPAANTQATETVTRAEVKVPDIGDFELVEVIDVLVASGARVEVEDPLITLESDKATMDIPAPVAGTVAAVAVKLGDQVSEGDLILTLETSGEVAPATPPAAAVASVDEHEEAAGDTESTPSVRKAPAPVAKSGAPGRAHASPSVRKFARELGVDVASVTGRGPKGRILKADVQAFVKDLVREGSGGGSSALALPAAPEVDFSKFGDIEVSTLSKIKRLTGRSMHRSWITVPHVFQMDEADITELEAFRKSKLNEAREQGFKLTLLAFIIKAVVVALEKYPDFNASLLPDNESIAHKKYIHIGVAVNTEHGLLVPVIRDADKKGLYKLAGEVRELSGKARERKLTLAEMQGGCFTVSSLGGVGGTAFTPIINLPEVAILGVSPSAMKPIYQNGAFVPRLILPLTLSFDHRVIDGVAAAQFTRFLITVLGDIRHLLL